MCEWREIGGLETKCSASDFLSGVDVWVKRPQVLNKRLLGAVVIEEETKRDERRGKGVVDEVLVRELLPRAKMARGREVVTTTHDHSRVSVTFDPLGGREGSVSRGLGSYMLQHYTEGPNRITVSIFCPSETNTMADQVASEFGQSREQVKDRLEDPSALGAVSSTGPNGVTTPTSEWLYSVLLPKVVQWSEESQSGEVSRREPLVPLAKYCSLYGHLKEKYGPALIQDWPEATDPHKFVYEDIAIATYLILLWEEERAELELREKQTFIDLGCGNGLLVYLLSSEGTVYPLSDLCDLLMETFNEYRGKGIDLRERKIWRCYGGRADLEVRSLTPSNVTVFPEFDWLIGNHSDELTPWIPLMAARSSYHTRYFVLPCCPHDFESRFTRPDTSKSQYGSYLDYVRHIGQTVGFHVLEDVLRIPSSKRVCQVGRKRWYSPLEEVEMETKRQAFLRERCSRGQRVAGDLKKGCRAKEHGGQMESIDVEQEEGKDHDHTERSSCLPEHQGKGLLEGALDKRQFKGCVSITAINHEGGGGEIESMWADKFVPRSSTEQTRNCTLVNRDLQKYIVKTLSSVLLRSENWIEIPRRTLTKSSTHTVLNSSESSDSNKEWNHNGITAGSIMVEGKGKIENESAIGGNHEASSEGEAMRSPVTIQWNLGGCMKVSEAVLLFDNNVLKQLKQECGGLQTLLRNHHQVFNVSGGFVQLRNWANVLQHGPRKPAKPRSVRDANILVKTKLCWFHSHHPQGCPRNAENCPYAHGREELRDRPDFTAVPVLQFPDMRSSLYY